jgi:hypothetical protein
MKSKRIFFGFSETSSFFLSEFGNRIYSNSFIPENIPKISGWKKGGDYYLL